MGFLWSEDAIFNHLIISNLYETRHLVSSLFYQNKAGWDSLLWCAVFYADSNKCQSECLKLCQTVGFYALVVGLPPGTLLLDQRPRWFLLSLLWLRWKCSSLSIDGMYTRCWYSYTSAHLSGVVGMVVVSSRVCTTISYLNHIISFSYRICLMIELVGECRLRFTPNIQWSSCWFDVWPSCCCEISRLLRFCAEVMSHLIATRYLSHNDEPTWSSPGWYNS